MVCICSTVMNSVVLIGIDALLGKIASFQQSDSTVSLTRPFAAEASWMTGNWTHLEELITKASDADLNSFNVAVGSALLSLRNAETDHFWATISRLRADLTRSMSTATIASLQSSHEIMVKLQALSELEEIAGPPVNADFDQASLTNTLTQRLEVIGAFNSDKQYLLGLRRAAMEASRYVSLL